jgi:multicomponent Na+:H+ antiporter subunit D
MTLSPMHPTIVLFTVALVVAMTRGVVRQLVLLVGTGATGWSVLQLMPGAHWSFPMPIATLQLLQVDALSHVFALIFSLITCLGVLYALHVRRGSEHVATLVYAGAALGVVFAGDWITLLTFWELMAVASLFVIWSGGTALSRAAGLRYLLVHLLGGSLLLCGILLHLTHDGSLTLRALTADAALSPVAFWLILLGVGLNAAIPPLHAWLPDAYPEASVTGSVFLSAFTTKTAVYVLIRLFPGSEILVWAGTAMTLYGVVYAILENDARRLLSYHIVSQVGYMVAGAGFGTALALNGASAHAFCHILYKALLFMGVGAVIAATGQGTLHDGGGLGRHLPLIFGLYMVAALSISGMPLFNGFISKSMIISAAAEAYRPLPELLMTLASVGTFLSVGLKLPYMLFLGPDRGIRPLRVPLNMLLAMLLSAGLCVWLGIFPDWLYVRLPFAATYHPYTIDHILSSLQLLVGTGLGFWWCLDRLGAETTLSLDTDWFYRKPFAQLSAALISTARQIGLHLETRGLKLLRTARPYIQNPVLVLITYGYPRNLWGQEQQRPRSALTDMVYDEDRHRLPIGVTILWIVIFFTLLALYAWTKG